LRFAELREYFSGDDLDKIYEKKEKMSF